MKHRKNIRGLLPGVFFFASIFVSLSCKGDLSPAPTVGPAWITFSTSNSPLKNNTINSLSVDHFGTVWIATDFGGYSYSVRSHSWGSFTDSLYSYSYFNNGGKIRSVTSVTFAKDKSIWFGFPTGELIRFDPFAEPTHVWKRVKGPSLVGTQITSLEAMRADWSQYGEIWVATSVGVRRFIQETEDGDGTWVSYGIVQFANNQVRCARANEDNNTVWFGSDYGGGAAQAQYDPQFEYLRLNFPPTTDSRVNDIAFDGNNTVWFAQQYGIHRYDLNTFTWNYYTHSLSNRTLPASEVSSVETYDSTMHWFGTGDGLVQLRDTTWTLFNTANSPLPDNRITYIRYDRFGNLWIGTKNGLAVYNPDGTRL